MNSERFGKILLVETPHFSEMMYPAFSEKQVKSEISKILNLHGTVHIFIVKKSDDSIMNNKMEKLLIQIYNQPKIKLIYIFTFYALSIDYRPTKNIKETIKIFSKINNNIYQKKL